jgi:hypothetical protein
LGNIFRNYSFRPTAYSLSRAQQKQDVSCFIPLQNGSRSAPGPAASSSRITQISFIIPSIDDRVEFVRAARKEASMIYFISSQRFLVPYSGILTLLFLFAALSGFGRVEPKQTFDEITVHRINVVEPNGTIRLVLTNTASSPGIYIKNKEYPHPNNRKSAGLLFFDEEGTEDGGLSYGISKDHSGRVTGSDGHLSFDQYMQDQIFTIDAGRDGDKKYSLLRMDDRGDYDIMDALEAVTRISKLPANQQQAELKKFQETHPGDHPRVILGRASDGGAALQLKDLEGRDRIVMRVAPDGTPKLQFLDAAGKVLSELPQNSASHP